MSCLWYVRVVTAHEMSRQHAGDEGRALPEGLRRLLRPMKPEEPLSLREGKPPKLWVLRGTGLSTPSGNISAGSRTQPSSESCTHVHTLKP